ncbi:2-C-methyl-D-erythritol 4-phosphate cytidylyltransferase [Staphylococcus coagulans]|uniref:2-C-methyl-D-erythritol 4-phosphate cytidylyltransferase n=1 Tax=Staphylococcus coagulans TaxID=74706 RepID=UPI003364DD3C
MTNYHVIIPAAGTGNRMGRAYNKLLIRVAGRTILEHTIDVFQKDDQCESIYLAIHPRDRERLQNILAPYNKIKGLIEGGKERQESIHKVIQHMNVAEDEVVLVHDGARPFITHQTIKEVTLAIEAYGAAIVGVKAKDTIKLVQNQFVSQTLDRSALWQVQTPQGSKFQHLKTAYDDAAAKKINDTDDASLLEASGQPIYMVEGDYDNIKVTTEEDLTYAEAIFDKRRKENHV